MELSAQQRRSLRARAHALDPVVLIGAAGLTAEVLTEIERNLLAHELIKIRVMGAGRDERETFLDALCRETGAAPVQHIGKVLVVFRERPAAVDETGPPKIKAKSATKQAGGRRKRKPAAARRRPRSR